MKRLESSELFLPKGIEKRDRKCFRNCSGAGKTNTWNGDAATQEEESKEAEESTEECILDRHMMTEMEGIIGTGMIITKKTTTPQEGEEMTAMTHTMTSMTKSMIDNATVMKEPGTTEEKGAERNLVIQETEEVTEKANTIETNTKSRTTITTRKLF